MSWLLTIAIILVVLWVLAEVLGFVVGAALHLLWIAALDNMRASDVATLPPYRDEALDDAYETDVRARFSGGATRQSPARPHEAAWYDDELYDGARAIAADVAD